MYEASKTNRIRGEEFKRQYLSGRVIDIGYGGDLVVPHAVPFDLPQGDAQRILDYFEPETFDCVHSSHCLEHMRNVKISLYNWWSLVKPGGYLIIVVPDEDLYEQGIWPSVFNPDHWATFNPGKLKSWSPVSYDIEALIKVLPGAEIVDARLQDDGYDRHLVRQDELNPFLLRLFRFSLLRYVLIDKMVMHIRPFSYRLSRGVSAAARPVNVALDRLERLLGKPIDQTLNAAVAKIQVVAQKQRGLVAAK